MQNHSHPKSSRFPLKRWCCKTTQNQKRSLIFTGTCFCTFTKPSCWLGALQAFNFIPDQFRTGSDDQSIHVRLTQMFWGFSKSEPAHLMCHLAITAIQIQKRPVSMSHCHDQGGWKSIGTVTCFFGMGCCWICFNHFEWADRSYLFQADRFERADHFDWPKVTELKPPRKAKKVKQPALKRPAKASRKRPAAASPQIPVPRPQIPSIKCRNHFFCIVADGSTSAGPGWVSGRRRKLWRTWWH